MGGRRWSVVPRRGDNRKKYYTFLSPSFTIVIGKWIKIYLLQFMSVMFGHDAEIQRWHASSGWLRSKRSKTANSRHRNSNLISRSFPYIELECHHHHHKDTTFPPHIKIPMTSTPVILLLCFTLMYKANGLSSSSGYDPNMKTKIASSVAKTERREKERAQISRDVCERCSRPPLLCVCQSLPDELVSINTNVLILQHPREFRRKSLSTVPLMPMILERCTVKVGYNFSPEQLDVVQDFLDRDQKPLVLFPGRDAISLDGKELSSNTNDEQSLNLKRIQQNEQLLILIDGTWAEARRMIMQSPDLMDQCQQVEFTSENESMYNVIRKEPEKHCLSTLEACARALVLLEPTSKQATEAKTTLEESMRYMIEKRLHAGELHDPNQRFRRPGAKIYERNKRRHEIKKELFS